MTPDTLSPADRDLLAKAKAAQGKACGPCAEWRAYNRVAQPAAIIDLITRLGEAQALWLEFLTPNNLRGLCGQSGVIDTRPLNLRSPARVPCGVKAFCICPNGRALAAQAPAAEGRES